MGSSQTWGLPLGGVPISFELSAGPSNRQQAGNLNVDFPSVSSRMEIGPPSVGREGDQCFGPKPGDGRGRRQRSGPLSQVRQLPAQALCLRVPRPMARGRWWGVPVGVTARPPGGDRGRQAECRVAHLTGLLSASAHTSAPTTPTPASK